MEKLWGCYLMDGNEFTIYGKCICLAETIDEAIYKSNKLEEKKGILTIVRQVGDTVQ